jgi:hypothetical protein
MSTEDQMDITVSHVVVPKPQRFYVQPIRTDIGVKRHIMDRKTNLPLTSDGQVLTWDRDDAVVVAAALNRANS